MKVKAKNCLFQIQNVTFVIFWVKSFDALNQIRLKKDFLRFEATSQSFLDFVSRQKNHNTIFGFQGQFFIGYILDMMEYVFPTPFLFLVEIHTDITINANQ